ncbi:MAG: Thioredoxin, partial [Pedobacter sp.]|nr:Thioredoxin [Pedobacter sp.]
CKDKSKFTINGKIENAAPKSKVYLFSLIKNNAVAIDSTVLSDKGEFMFSQSSEGVNFFKVTADKNEYMIIAKNGDDIKLQADLSDSNMDYKLSGAEEADKLQELNVNKNRYTAKMAEIQKQFEEQVEAQPQNREAIANQMRPALMKETQGLVDFILKFANDNPNSLASFYAINSLNPSDYEKEFIAYSDKIKSTFNNNAAVTEFLVRMAKLKSVQVGQPAPAFSMKTIDGKTTSLAEFKGKYVLLDFWASWCMPCRQENPNVVKAYNKFKERNFTILSVSLDKDPAAWKQAVAADKLTWTHASELSDFEGPTVRLYQVEAIPSSFLIDPSGKIVAKNLRGEELVQFLDKTL